MKKVKEKVEVKIEENLIVSPVNTVNLFRVIKPINGNINSKNYKINMGEMVELTPTEEFIFKNNIEKV